MTFVKNNVDLFGASASTLCLLHCMATPFVFIAQSCAITCCQTKQLWWQSIDYFFLIISFFAIKQTVKQTTSNWMKPLLWFSWSVLLVVIVNEKLEYLPLNNYAIYFPSIALVILHLYNRKYCQCNENKCCASEGK